MVFIANTRMIQSVIANEGLMPHHNIPEAWSLYNQVRGIERGLFFQMGESWLRLRRALNKVLLADAARTRRFASKIVTINNDLFDSWRARLSGNHDNSFVVEDVKFELCKWSIEATGLMLFGQRMGCLANGPSDPRAEQLVLNVATMFQETSRFQIIPAKIARRLNLSSWKRFLRASDTMIELASALATEFLNRSRQENSEESLVKDLLDMASLSDEEISRSMVDLIIAAADTTSSSLQWMLYMLAKHPECQSRIQEEVCAMAGDDCGRIQVNTPYLSGFIKEVSRLYPTAPFLARTLDRPVALDGYNVPAGTPIVFSLFTTSRMEEYFEDASKFKPERWTRRSESARHQSHAYATLPFGIGARMCIGRRMADLEMHSLIASVVSKFHVSLANPDETMRIKLKMILEPDKPINLCMKPRTPVKIQ